MKPIPGVKTPRVHLLVAPLLAAFALAGCRQAPPANPATETPAPSAPVQPAPQVTAPAVEADDTRHRYTPLAGTACTLLSLDKEAGGSTTRCPGLGGYQLIVQDSDARMSLQVQRGAGAPQSLWLSQLSNGAFSALGERAEWWLDASGAPAALIVRYNAYMHPEQPERATSFLVVVKLEPQACVVDVVPAGPDQNAKARDIADRAAGMACRSNDGS